MRVRQNNERKVLQSKFRAWGINILRTKIQSKIVSMIMLKIKRILLRNAFCRVGSFNG
jgi:hypothetical protein